MQVMNGGISDDEDTSETSSKKKANENNMNRGLDSNDSGSKHQRAPKPISKKAKKMQRMALMGEGFDSVMFSGVNDDALNGIEPSDDEMDVSNNDSSTTNGIVKPNALSSVKRKPKHSISEAPQSGKKKKKNQ